MADIDLQRMGGVGGGGEGGSHPDHPDPEIREKGAVSNFFRPFGPQFGLKIKGGERGPPDFSPGSATEGYCLTQFTYTTAFRKEPLKCSRTTLI